MDTWTKETSTNLLVAVKHLDVSKHQGYIKKMGPSTFFSRQMMIVSKKAKLVRSQHPDSQDTQGTTEHCALVRSPKEQLSLCCPSQVWRKRNKDWNSPVYTKDIRGHLQMQSLMPTWCSKRWWQIGEVVAGDRDFLKTFHYIFSNTSPQKNWQSFLQPPVVNVLLFPFLYPPFQNKQMEKASMLSSETGARLRAFFPISGLGNKHWGLVAGVEIMTKLECLLELNPKKRFWDIIQNLSKRTFSAPNNQTWRFQKQVNRERADNTYLHKRQNKAEGTIPHHTRLLP